MPALLALALAARLPVDVPVVLGRDEAQRLARLELARPEYAADGQPWTQRAIGWLLDRIAQLLQVVGGTSPLGWFGLLGLVLLVAVAAAAVRRRTGRLAVLRPASSPLDGGGRDADDLRAEAERLAAAGAWAEAVRARLRAVVRALEERGLVDARPGRTADEIAAEAGAALPAVAVDIRSAARIFDDVWYGGRPAGPAAYDRLVDLDRAVAVARPVPGAAAPRLAVPR